MLRDPQKREDVSRLFALLRGSLLSHPMDEQKFASVSIEGWQRLFSLSQQNNITALTLDGVMLLPSECRPPRQILVPWLVEREKVIQTYERKFGVEQELIQFFEQKSIPTQILKGTSLSRYYPEPTHRPSSDIDIYQHGHQREADKLIADQMGVEVIANAHHHTKYFLKGVMVESHYDFLNVHTPPSNRRYEKLLKALDTQSATFEALFLLRHMSGHFVASRINVRNFCDWVMFLRARGHEVDWSSVSLLLESFGMMPFVSILQAIAEDYLLQKPIDKIRRCSDNRLNDRMLSDIVFGEFSEQEHKKEDLGRLIWKMRRRQANSWKLKLVYNDSRFMMGLSSVLAHLQRPHSILHKV